MHRRVVVFDADEPAHAASEGVHGFFGHDGTPPLELRRLGGSSYALTAAFTVRMGTVEEVEATSGGFCRAGRWDDDRGGCVVLVFGNVPESRSSGCRSDPEAVRATAIEVWLSSLNYPETVSF